MGQYRAVTNRFLRNRERISVQIDDRQRAAARVTMRGSAANAFLTAGKLVAGLAGASAAMVADAVHSLSDFMTDIVVLVTIGVAGKPRDENHNYGHGKYETIGSLIIGLVLLGVAAGIGISSAAAIVAATEGIFPQEPGLVALAAAIVSIVVKEWMYWYTRAEGKRLQSPALVANAWHHRSDALSSVAALVGIGGARLLGGAWSVLDPIAGLIVSLVIAGVAVKITVDNVNVLVEVSPSSDIREGIISTVLSVAGVSDPHNLRVRWVGPTLALDLHIRVDGALTVIRAHELATEVEAALRGRFGSGTLMNIHVEPEKQA